MRYAAGTKWLPAHINIVLEEYQRNPLCYSKGAAERLGRSRKAVVRFVSHAGGIQTLFSGAGHDK